jgi:hypothetical protein
MVLVKADAAGDAEFTFIEPGTFEGEYGFIMAGEFIAVVSFVDVIIIFVDLMATFVPTGATFVITGGALENNGGEFVYTGADESEG